MFSPTFVKDSYLLCLNNIIPLDKQEEQDGKEVKEWMLHTEELCKPENMEKHLGVLAVILSKDRQKTFLIHHKKARAWLPPGGDVIKDQTLEEAVAMELQEELAIETPKYLREGPFFLTQTKINELNAEHTDVTLWFTLEGDSTKQYSVLEKEALERKWFLVQEVLANQDFSHLHRAFSKI